MKVYAILVASACALLISACTQWPRYPEVDSSPNVDLTSITKQLGWKHCKVSIPLTKGQVIQAAKFYGDPHPEERPAWATMVAKIRPGDQLRQVSCFQNGSSGDTAGDIFYALFRGGEMVAQMHTIIIN